MSRSSAVLRGSDLGALPVVSFAPSSDATDEAAADDQPVTVDQHPAPSEAHEAAEEPDPGHDVEEIYQRGWDAGHEAALASVEARTAHSVDALGEALRAVELALEHQQRAADELAVDLALELTRLLLDRELAAVDDPGREAILRCLHELPTGRRATIRLNPDDLQRLDDRQAIVGGTDYELVPDPSLESGDAVVEFDGGNVDATLAAALARIAEVLKP